MTLTLPFSEACQRNQSIILDVLEPYFSNIDSVLEIGSGTGQHAVYFSKAKPHLSWQTSDQTNYLEGLNAQLQNANVANIKYPFELNVNQSPWVKEGRRYSGIYTANTFHIMAWSDVQAFFNGLPSVSKDNAYLFVYGPFKYNGAFTSESNSKFDETLRARECGSAIRDFEAVNELAQAAGFDLLSDTPMPANNQCIVWQRR